jgi:hypothetical protein
MSTATWELLSYVVTTIAFRALVPTLLEGEDAEFGD